MKRLVLVLSVVFVTMSSFTTITSNNLLEKMDVQQDCFTSCSQYASALAQTYGLNHAQQFAAFEQCYDNNCGGSDGQFTFPSME